MEALVRVNLSSQIYLSQIWEKDDSVAKLVNRIDDI